MMKQGSNWVKKPTTKHMLVGTLCWIVGVFCLLLATTDNFTQSPFQGKNIILGGAWVMATVVIVTVWRNYFKNRGNKQ